MFAHPLTQVLGCNFGFVAGRVQTNGTSVSLQTIASPIVLSGDTSVTRIAAGQYQITIANFGGPNRLCIPTVSAGSTSTASQGVSTLPGLSTSIVLNSFASLTSDTYSFTIQINSGNTFVDADAYFQVFSF